MDKCKQLCVVAYFFLQYETFQKEQIAEKEKGL